MDFKYKKNLGQNFLQDAKILESIANSVEVESDDLIIEIGPGHGALSEYLVKRGCDVIAFEIDLDVKPFLDKIDALNFGVIYKDFMSVNIKEEIDLEIYNHINIIANIPYYITTPILEKIIESKIGETDLVLMVQREVADRFSAKCGTSNYGSVTVMLNYYYNITKLFDVSKKSFYPVPNVDSAVIKLVRKANCDVDNAESFLKFVKKCFVFKRKNIRNNLKDLDQNKLENVLKIYNHTLQDRAEDFSLDEFLEIYNQFYNN